ncbi:MAG: bifunctional folylpolyglutamate synthase/dihydrofolate synthase [Chloroflexota bacterium]
MDYNEALRYLYSFTDYEKKTGYAYSAETFDLRRPRELLALLGDPHMRFPSVLVAGTKGKGSTSAMLVSILQAAGRRVGLYSQPHLHSFRERIRVNGRPIAPQEMALAVEAVAPAVEELRRTRPELGVPTTYEVATAAAMHYFAAQQPDLVVLEVGLGGRLDATNVANPLVSVIAPVSLDHVQILGNTIAQIAAEKAGIIKEQGVVVAAEQTAEAIQVIRRVASERGARLVVARPEVAESPVEAPAQPLGEGEAARPRRERTLVALRSPSGGIYRFGLPLLGAHQVANAATAIAVVEELALRGFPIDREAVERGLGQVRWPGRMEVIRREPLVVADGAHNGDSATKLAAALRENFLYRRLILVLGTSADKDVEGIAAALAPEASVVVATRSRHPRAADPERIAAAVPRELCPQVEVTGDFTSAIGLATALAAPGDLICVTGSLFIVADARDHYGLAEERD